MSAPILVLCPMECEYRVLKERITQNKVSFFGDFEYTEGTVDGYPVLLVNCLTGFINSAAVCMHFIDAYAPLCVIAQGTAGAHKESLQVNDILLGEKIVENQTYFSKPRAEGENSVFEDWDFIGVERRKENGEVVRIREYSSDEELMRIAESVPYPYGNVRRGVICSGDAWNREVDRIRYFAKTFDSDCEEMEAFAVAQVCEMFGVKHLSVRIISNNELLPNGAFSEKSAEICQLYCLEIIRKIVSLQ